MIFMTRNLLLHGVNIRAKNHVSTLWKRTAGCVRRFGSFIPVGRVELVHDKNESVVSLVHGSQSKLPLSQSSRQKNLFQLLSVVAVDVVTTARVVVAVEASRLEGQSQRTF
jgi:hypothetical protein